MKNTLKENKLLNRNFVNTGRQYEIDLARSFMVLCLALIHCIIECTPEEGLANGIPYLFDTIIGGPFSAPLYMFIMGIGMVYTNRNSATHHFRRGIRLVGVFYVLNICRFLIPYSIGYAVTQDADKYLQPLIYKVLGNDVLLFAGLSMMIIALMLRLKIKPLMMAAFGLVLSVFGTILNGLDVGNPMGNIFLGYLIGTEDAAGLVISDFPVLNWLLVPICGYIFGRILKRVENKSRFYLLVSAPALVLTVTYFVYGIYTGNGMFGEGQNCYYHMITTDSLASILLSVSMLGVCNLLCGILPKRIIGVSMEISRNVTSIYCIHWVFVVVITNLFMYIIRGTQTLAPWMSLALGACISAISVVVAHFYSEWKKKGISI